MPSIPEVTSLSPTWMSALPPQVFEAQPIVAGAGHHALRARSLDERAGGGVAIDQQLHFGRAGARHDDAPDDARRGEHRHVGTQSARSALADRYGAEVWCGRRSNDFSGRRFDRRRFTQIE